MEMKFNSRVFLMLLAAIFLIICLSNFVIPEIQNQMNDTSTSKTFGKSGSWSNLTYIKLPKYAIISNASLNLTGAVSAGGGISNSSDDTEDAFSWTASSLDPIGSGNAVDENWSSSANNRFISGGQNLTYYINYTRPSNQVGATWEIKYDLAAGSVEGSCYNGGWSQIFLDNTDGGEERTNFTVPSGCLDESDGVVQFQVKSFTTSSAAQKFFEEQIIWALDTGVYPKNITLDISNDGDIEYAYLQTSTNLILQDADTENLEDTYGQIATGVTDGSAGTTMLSGDASADTTIYQAYIKFALDTAGLGTINSARLFLYQVEGEQEGRWNSGQNFMVYQISNQTWVESSCRGHSSLFPCPAAGSLISSIDVSSFSASDGAWTNYSVIDWVNENSINNANKNISFMVNFTAGANGRLHKFATKEYVADTSKRPYLLINHNNPNFIGNFSVTNMTTEINNYLSSCTADAQGFCNVPLNLSGIDGLVTINSINIVYIEVPRISIVTPTNNTNTTNSQININYTRSDTNLDSCWYTRNGGITNTTISGCDNLTSVTWNEGINNVTIYANDTSGNVNSSSVRFRVDTIAPSLVLVHPIDSQAFDYNNSISLNFTVSDSGIGLGSCWYNLDNGLNLTLANCQNSSFNTSEGNHVLNLFANDTLNNRRNVSASFVVALDSPAVNLNSPANGRFFNTNNNIYLNYTATDGNGIDFCDIWHNLNGTFLLNQTNNGVTSGQQNFTIVNASEDGEWMWNVECTDTTSQSAFALNNFTFTTDTHYPVFHSVQLITTQGSQTVNFNVTNFTEINCNETYYSVYKNGTIENGIENETTSCSDFSDFFVVSAYSNYLLRLYIGDKAGNLNYTDINFTTAESSVIIIEPGGSAGTTTTTISRISSPNFTITTIGGGNKMDIVLAKDSVKPSVRSFTIVNLDIEPIEVEVVCDTSLLTSNETTLEGQAVDICDYVNFEVENLVLSPNEQVNTEGIIEVNSPLNATFDDEYNFNILALENLGTIEGGQVFQRFAKLSVSARVPVWALIFKWSYVPFQDEATPNKTAYPIWLVSSFSGLILFTITFFSLRKKFPAFALLFGMFLFVVTMFALLFFL